MNRLIVVSNRLPFALDSAGEDLWTVTPAVGGLVSAVEPVLRERGGTWIGWPGTAGKIPNEPLAKATRDAGYNVVPVALSETERDEFYYGYSNEVIWPLFHDLQNFCNFDPAYWQAYKQVNERYADAIIRSAQRDDFIWVHDYHLMYVAQALRERSASQKLSALDIFPAHPVSAVRHFCEAAATTAAPAPAAAVRSPRVPDPPRRAQLSSVREARDAGRESSFSRRDACDPIRKAKNSRRAFPDRHRFRLVRKRRKIRGGQRKGRNSCAPVFPIVS